MIHSEWLKRDLIITVVGCAIAIGSLFIPQEWLNGGVQVAVMFLGVFTMVVTMVNRLFKGYITED
jgi:hypothetical protein